MAMMRIFHDTKVKILIFAVILCLLLPGIGLHIYNASKTTDFMAQPCWRRMEGELYEPFVSYNFFSNPNQWYLNLDLEMRAAQVICDYAPDDSEEGTWELCKMHVRLEQEQPDAASIYARSKAGRELYLLSEYDGWERRYLVMADVPSNAGEDYDTGLLWESYQDASDSPDHYSGYSVYVDEDAYIYDKDMIDEGVKAAKAYRARLEDDQTTWRLLEHMTYIGANGYLASLWFYDGSQRVHMMVDVRNKKYSVAEIYAEQDAVCYADWDTGLVPDIEVSKHWHKLDGAEAGEDYFTNAEQLYYDADVKQAAARAVRAYSEKKGLQAEKWQLTNLYSENGIRHVFVRSESYRKLSLLLKEDEWMVIADIQTGNEAQRKLIDGFSYDSVLQWHSYEPWVMEEKDFAYSVSNERTSKYDQYDSVYGFQLVCAMQAYLADTDADKSEEWNVVYDRFFAGHGCLVDAWYTSGDKQVHLFIDTLNRLYAVIER